MIHANQSEGTLRHPGLSRLLQANERDPEHVIGSVITGLIKQTRQTCATQGEQFAIFAIYLIIRNFI